MNNKTELVFILDMSGSMEHLTDDTIGGFNSILKEQAAKEGEAMVTTYLFNNSNRMIHDRLAIANVAPMTKNEYRASGCTALVDALGDAIHHIAGIHHYARKEDVPEHTVFVITTDGMENASRIYSYDKVQRMVKHEQEKYGWEFLFLGANMDAISAARSFGIRSDRAVRYASDRAGTRLNYSVVGQTIARFRCEDEISADWSAPIEADFRSREK